MAGRVSGKRRRKGEKGGRGTGAAAGDEDDLAGEGGGANGAVFCHADGLVGRRVSGSFEKRQNGAEGWRGVDTRERVKKSRFRKRVYTTATSSCCLLEFRSTFCVIRVFNKERKSLQEEFRSIAPSIKPWRYQYPKCGEGEVYRNFSTLWPRCDGGTW